MYEMTNILKLDEMDAHNFDFYSSFFIFDIINGKHFQILEIAIHKWKINIFPVSAKISNILFIVCKVAIF